MRVVFVSALMLISLYGTSQSRMGLYFAGGRAYRNFGSTNNTSIPREIPKFGYSIGLDYEQHLKNRLWLSTGLYFTNRGYRKPEISVAVQGNAAPNTFKSFNSRHSLYELGIPVSALYYLTNTEWRFFASGGIEINYLMEARETFTITTVDENKIKSAFKYNRSNYNLVNIAGKIGAGIERDYKKYTFRLFSLFTYALNNYYKKQTGSVMHPYWHAMELGVYRNFK